jgi:hypothetical protein
MKKYTYLIIAFLLSAPHIFKSQTTGLDKGIAIGNILVQGYSALKGNGKTIDPNAKTVDSFCLKNKMEDRISVILTGKIEDEDVKKELVIPRDSKQCIYDLRKGIYTYEIILSSKETYQKGEYRISEEAVMTINP